MPGVACSRAGPSGQMGHMNLEHRLYRRARILLPVIVRVGNEPPIHAVATDLSVGGLFLLDDARISRAREAQVEVELDAEHTVRAQARVVRQQHPERESPRGLDVPGLGLAFESLADPEAHAIAMLVEGKAA